MHPKAKGTKFLQAAKTAELKGSSSKSSTRQPTIISMWHTQAIFWGFSLFIFKQTISSQSVWLTCSEKVLKEVSANIGWLVCFIGILVTQCQNKIKTLKKTQVISAKSKESYLGCLCMVFWGVGVTDPSLQAVIFVNVKFKCHTWT